MSSSKGTLEEEETLTHSLLLFISSLIFSLSRLIFRVFIAGLIPFGSFCCQEEEEEGKEDMREKERERERRQVGNGLL